jgi:hypothetical protein
MYGNALSFQGSNVTTHAKRSCPESRNGVIKVKQCCGLVVGLVSQDLKPREIIQIGDAYMIDGNK